MPATVPYPETAQYSPQVRRIFMLNVILIYNVHQQYLTVFLK